MRQQQSGQAPVLGQPRGDRTIREEVLPAELLGIQQKPSMAVKCAQPGMIDTEAHQTSCCQQDGPRNYFLNREGWQSWSSNSFGSPTWGFEPGIPLHPQLTIILISLWGSGHRGKESGTYNLQTTKCCVNVRHGFTLKSDSRSDLFLGSGILAIVCCRIFLGLCSLRLKLQAKLRTILNKTSSKHWKNVGSVCVRNLKTREALPPGSRLQTRIKKSPPPRETQPLASVTGLERLLKGPLMVSWAAIVLVQTGQQSPTGSY